MKVFTKIRKALLIALFAVPAGNSAWSQYSEGFESSCSDYGYSFQNGCISGWISSSGTPDTKSIAGPAYQGSRYAHMYARFDPGCVNTEGSEGIVLNYTFQAGVTYKLSYATKGGSGVNISETYTANWILTNGLSNQSGNACTAGEITPAIPSGSQVLGSPVLNNAVWTPNQTITFTPTVNYSQLWFRHTLTSTVNTLATVIMMIDDIKIDEICNLVPSISGPAAFCEGAAMNFTGSVANGCPVENHVWTVVETDQFGNVVPGATEWWSPWMGGSPGSYTIPSVANGGPAMPCGRYYRVNLAVADQNTPWAAVSKFIYVNCPPKFKVKGSTTEICTGGTAYLTVTMNPGSNSTYTMDVTPISPTGPSIYNGPLAYIAASPSVTTVYELTVTDNATGCSSTKQGTLTFSPNDPSFSLNVNTTNPNYFTVSLTANDLTAGSAPGFFYSLAIEELDGSFNGYYQNIGNDCWWNYPGAETFKGYVSTATGAYGQTPWGSCASAIQPASGQFMYNHLYRITRVTWNDKCPRNQFSMIIMPVKSGNGHDVVVFEDKDAPDLTNHSLGTSENVLGKDNSVEIYPNPGTGLYTISLTESENVNITIYNLLGAKVKDFEPKGTTTAFDLTGFPKGIYMVKIQSEKEQISKKITLE